MAFMNPLQYRDALTPFVKTNPSADYPFSSTAWGDGTTTNTMSFCALDLLLSPVPFLPLVQHILCISEIAVVTDYDPANTFDTHTAGNTALDDGTPITATAPYVRLGHWVNPEWQAVLDAASDTTSVSLPTIRTLMAGTLTTSTALKDNSGVMHSVRQAVDPLRVGTEQTVLPSPRSGPNSTASFTSVLPAATPLGFYLSDGGSISIPLSAADGTVNIYETFLQIRLRTIGSNTTDGGAISRSGTRAELLARPFVDVVVPMSELVMLLTADADVMSSATTVTDIQTAANNLRSNFDFYNASDDTTPARYRPEELVTIDSMHAFPSPTVSSGVSYSVAPCYVYIAPQATSAYVLDLVPPSSAPADSYDRLDASPIWI